MTSVGWIFAATAWAGNSFLLSTDRLSRVLSAIGFGAGLIGLATEAAIWLGA